MPVLTDRRIFHSVHCFDGLSKSKKYRTLAFFLLPPFHQVLQGAKLLPFAKLSFLGLLQELNYHNKYHFHAIQWLSANFPPLGNI
jgi:hypothetical protein